MQDHRMPGAALAHALCFCMIGFNRVTNPPGLLLRTVPTHPTKKATLEMAECHFIILCASETKVTAIKKSPNKQGHIADSI